MSPTKSGAVSLAVEPALVAAHHLAGQRAAIDRFDPFGLVRRIVPQHGIDEPEYQRGGNDNGGTKQRSSLGKDPKGWDENGNGRGVAGCILLAGFRASE